MAHSAVRWLRRAFLGSPGDLPKGKPIIPENDLYLPLQIEGVPVFRKIGEDTFQAVNNLGESCPGVHFRMTNSLEAAYPDVLAYLPWKSSVTGKILNDEWIIVSGKNGPCTPEQVSNAYDFWARYEILLTEAQAPALTQDEPLPQPGDTEHVPSFGGPPPQILDQQQNASACSVSGAHVAVPTSPMPPISPRSHPQLTPDARFRMGKGIGKTVPINRAALTNSSFQFPMEAKDLVVNQGLIDLSKTIPLPQTMPQVMSISLDTPAASLSPRDPKSSSSTSNLAITDPGPFLAPENVNLLQIQSSESGVRPRSSGSTIDSSGENQIVRSGPSQSGPGISSKDLEMRSHLMEVFEMNRILSEENRMAFAQMRALKDEFTTQRKRDFDAFELQQQQIAAQNERNLRSQLEDQRAASAIEQHQLNYQLQTVQEQQQEDQIRMLSTIARLETTEAITENRTNYEFEALKIRQQQLQEEASLVTPPTTRAVLSPAQENQSDQFQAELDENFRLVEMAARLPGESQEEIQASFPAPPPMPTSFNQLPEGISGAQPRDPWNEMISLIQQMQVNVERSMASGLASMATRLDSFQDRMTNLEDAWWSDEGKAEEQQEEQLPFFGTEASETSPGYFGLGSQFEPPPTATFPRTRLRTFGTAAPSEATFGARKEIDDDSDKEVAGFAVKRKEQDHIGVKALPEPKHFKNWKSVFKKDIAGASAFPPQAFQWINEVEDENQTFERLHESGKFHTLDFKLCKELYAHIRGELLHRIQLVEEEYAQEKPPRLISGRQLLFMVYEWYKVEEDDKAVHDIKRLLNLRMHNNDLAKWQFEWDAELLRQNEEVPLHLKHTLYQEKVEHHPLMAADMEHYHRLERGHQDKSYQWLHERVNAVFGQKKEGNKLTEI